MRCSTRPGTNWSHPGTPRSPSTPSPRGPEPAGPWSTAAGPPSTTSCGRPSGTPERRTSFPLPDTGTLRGDLIALLQRANETRLGFAAVLSVRLGQYFEETGTGPADLREEMIGDRTTSVQRVIERSIARGEIDPARLTPRIADLPFDLFRHEVLMTMKPVPQATLEEIIDTIFLPLVVPHKEA